jgi:hypothetical protein
MEIKFSRHAKRRAELYGIPQSTIPGILQEKNCSRELSFEERI